MTEERQIVASVLPGMTGHDLRWFLQHPARINVGWCARDRKFRTEAGC